MLDGYRGSSFDLPARARFARQPVYGARVSDAVELFDAGFFQRQGTAFEPLETERAASLLYRLKHHIVVSRGRGYVDAPHIEHLIGYCDAVLREVPAIVVFHDWFAVTGYESRARQLMTPWAIRTRAQHTAIHIGVTSQVVRMGISVVALASRAPIETYGTGMALGAALAGALRPSSVIPPSSR
jgi:hypothetical protein